MSAEGESAACARISQAKGQGRTFPAEILRILFFVFSRLFPELHPFTTNQFEGTKKMDAIGSFVEQIVGTVNTFLWDYALLILLVGAGIFFTVMLRFIQIRKFGAGMKSLFGNFSLHGKDGGKGLSSFQALTTAIAAQVGTGNIAGAATAIHAGGPGAIFWMWVSAFFGMATIYAEAVMAQKTRVEEKGTITGGPVYYIKYAFKGRFGKFLAGFFSVAVILALGFMGNMVQSNSIGDSFHNVFGINPHNRSDSRIYISWRYQTYREIYRKDRAAYGCTLHRRMSDSAYNDRFWRWTGVS